MFANTDPFRKARVLIVDDHAAARDELTLRIQAQPDMEVCGWAADDFDALLQIVSAHPDVVVLEISLGTVDGSGLELIRRFKVQSRARILVWSKYREAHYTERVLRAGAMGFITKAQSCDEVLRAIRTVLTGRIYLSDLFTEGRFHPNGQGELVKHSLVDALCDRELEVFRLLGRGLETDEIAARMRLSHKTVETYRYRIKAKLGFASQIELAHCAAEWAVEN
jgi:DNA-binding NarL/FixJ family response regulator